MVKKHNTNMLDMVQGLFFQNCWYHQSVDKK